MAHVMMRNTTPSGAPPLPPGHPTSRPPGAKDGRSQSVPHVHHVRLVKQHSEGSEPHRQDVSGQVRGHPIQRRDFETKSFIDRNTAKAFSNPDSYARGTGNSTPVRRRVDHVEYPEDTSRPAPPPLTTLPRHPSSAGDHRKTAGAAPPPPPVTAPPRARPDLPVSNPPARPPKGSPNDPAPAPSRPLKTFNSPPPEPVPTRAPKTSSSSSNHTPARPPQSLPIQPERPPKTVQNARSPDSYTVSPRHSPRSPDVVTPPARPPKSVSSSSLSSMHDLEVRFCFHDPSEFPPPEDMSGIPKTRASMTKSLRRVDQQERMGYL